MTTAAIGISSNSCSDEALSESEWTFVEPRQTHERTHSDFLNSTTPPLQIQPFLGYTHVRRPHATQSVRGHPYCNEAAICHAPPGWIETANKPEGLKRMLDEIYCFECTDIRLMSLPADSSPVFILSANYGGMYIWESRTSTLYFLTATWTTHGLWEFLQTHKSWKDLPRKILKPHHHVVLPVEHIPAHIIPEAWSEAHDWSDDQDDAPSMVIRQYRFPPTAPLLNSNFGEAYLWRCGDHHYVYNAIESHLYRIDYPITRDEICYVLADPDRQLESTLVHPSPEAGGWCNVGEEDVPKGWCRDLSVSYPRYDFAGLGTLKGKGRKNLEKRMAKLLLASEGKDGERARELFWCEPHYYIRFLDNEDVDRVTESRGLCGILDTLRDPEKRLTTEPARRGDRWVPIQHCFELASS